jgi:archaellin
LVFCFQQQRPPPQTVFDIHITASAGGSVTADRTSAETGETVTLTITPAAGYELVSLTANGVTLYGSGDTRTFTMPARDVTVTAVFRRMSYQSAWAAAKELIENATFSIRQHEIDASSPAATESALRYRLAALVNELIKQTGFTVSPSDIVILSGFVPPTAGDADNPDGTDGTFRFRVSPPDTGTSAYSSGTVTASPVASEVIASPPRLRAWTLNGTLYVSGLQPGATLQVYNLAGRPVYTGKTTPSSGHPSTGGEFSAAGEFAVPLPSRGVYIIHSDRQAVKAVY